MDFYEWRKSDTYSSKKFNERIEAGEEGNKTNPQIAGEIAYNAGITEGLRLAKERVGYIIDNLNRG